MTTLSSFSYPLEIDEVTGGLKLQTGYKVREYNLKSLIETVIRERVLIPDYGSPLYLFEVLPNIALVNNQLKRAIERYVPDVKATITSNINNDGNLAVEILWYWLEEQNSKPRTINTTITF
jgi:phage baseplate assembly protein W